MRAKACTLPINVAQRTEASTCTVLIQVLPEQRPETASIDVQLAVWARCTSILGRLSIHLFRKACLNQVMKIALRRVPAYPQQVQCIHSLHQAVDLERSWTLAEHSNNQVAAELITGFLVERQCDRHGMRDGTMHVRERS